MSQEPTTSRPATPVVLGAAPGARPGDSGAAKSLPTMLRRTMLVGRPDHFAGVASRACGLDDERPKAFTGKSSIDLALKQWHELVKLLRSHGVDVLAARPDRAVPDLAFMGLAGFLGDRSARTYVSDKTFILSSLEPKQSALQEAFGRAAASVGLRCRTLDYRFGGSCDLFRCGANYVFSCGAEAIDEPEQSGARRLISRLVGKKPAFTSDPRLRETLVGMLAGHDVLQFTLIDPRYCRGDMVACGVGEDRRALVVYVKALAEDSQRLVLGRKARVSETVIPLSDADAAMYAAGCLQLPSKHQGGQPVVVLPEGVSTDLVGRLERAGCECVLLDMSEWIKKDRGGLSSMVLDLGYLRDDKRTDTPEVREQRAVMRQGLDQPPKAG